MATPLYRKTPAGSTEIRERRAGLDARLRTLLILCNGQLGEAELSAHMNLPVAPLLEQLRGMGLLELAAPASRSAAAARPQPQAQAPAPAPPKPASSPLRTPAFTPERAGAPSLKAALSAFTSTFGASRYDPGSTLSPDIPLTAEEHAAMIQRAWQLLQPLFGAGTGERIEPLERATEPTDVRRALADIHDALAIYRGRKSAAELVARIERG